MHIDGASNVVENYNNRIYYNFLTEIRVNHSVDKFRSNDRGKGVLNTPTQQLIETTAIRGLASDGQGPGK